MMFLRLVEPLTNPEDPESRTGGPSITIGPLKRIQVTESVELQLEPQQGVTVSQTRLSSHFGAIQHGDCFYNSFEILAAA